MKKLIHPWTLPFMFACVMILNVINSPKVYAAEDSIVVPAVIYKGKTIPVVNLPEVEIVSKKTSREISNNDSRRNGPPKKKYIKLVYDS